MTTRTTTFDLGATAAAAVILLGLASGLGPNQNATAVTSCERIDQGGYFTFADPTCAAGFRTAGSDDPVAAAAEPEPEPESEPETDPGETAGDDTAGTAGEGPSHDPA